MRSAGLLIAMAMLVLAAAPSGRPLAQESLGNEAADAAVAALKARAGGAELACAIKAGFVVCTGQRTGDCLAEGWLVSHDGRECRKNLE